MIIRLEKELFQWEKGRYVFVDLEESDPMITCVRFYNSRSAHSVDSAYEDGRALIPNVLLKQSLPITALVCCGENGENHAITRKVFKVIPTAKPENYEDDSILNGDIIYDGGEEV